MTTIPPILWFYVLTNRFGSNNSSSSSSSSSVSSIAVFLKILVISLHK